MHQFESLLGLNLPEERYLKPQTPGRQGRAGWGSEVDNNPTLATSYHFLLSRFSSLLQWNSNLKVDSI